MMQKYEWPEGAHRDDHGYRDRRNAANHHGFVLKMTATDRTDKAA